MRLTAGLFLLMLAWIPRAWAKTVVLEWDEVPEATRYELEISREGKVLKTVKLENTEWKGSLSPGVYLYRIRGYDGLERPGMWSDSLDLVVTPESIRLNLPEDGTELSTFRADARVTLQWTAVAGANGYEVHLESPQGSQSLKVDGQATSWQGNLAEGRYEWKVTPIFRKSGQTKEWKVRSSDLWDFRVVKKDFPAPEVIGPIGSVTPPKDGKLVFSWKPVAGAKGYRIKIIPSGSRSPASVPDQTVSGTRVAVALPQQGSYQWMVAAVDEDVVSRSTEASFELNPQMLFQERTGFFAFSLLGSTSHYTAGGPATTGVNGKDVNSSGGYGGAARLSGEYFVHPKWGVGLALERGGVSFTGRDKTTRFFDRGDVELTVRHRINLDRSATGWVIYPKVGFAMRDFFAIRGDQSTSFGYGKDNFTVWGPTAGIDVRRQITPRFSLGGKLNFLFAQGVMMPSHQETLYGSNTLKNWSVGLQAISWTEGAWGFGYGAFYDHRSIAYQTNLPALTVSTSDHEYIDNNNIYLYLSVIYRFSK